MRILRWLDKYTEELLMGVALLVIVFIMGLQVVLRYIFRNTLNFSEELARYLFIWISFLGISYTIKMDNPLRIDLIGIVFPRLWTFFRIFSQVVVLIFCITVIPAGFSVTTSIMRFKQISAALFLPMWIVYVSFLVGVVLGTIRLIQWFILAYKNWKTTGKFTVPMNESGENGGDV